MHRQTKEWYAIKSIRKAKVSKIEVLTREINILKEVKHPNIIEVRPGVLYDVTLSRISISSFTSS